MKKISEIPLGLGFKLIQESTDQVLPQETSIGFIGTMNRLEQLANSQLTLHYHRLAMMEFIEETRKTFKEHGQSVKIEAPVPISAICFELASRPHQTTYKILYTLFNKKVCRFDLTTGYKLKDFINCAFKSIFNITYYLTEQNGQPAIVRKQYPEDRKIKDIVDTLQEIDHPKFVLQAIQGLVKVEPNQTYTGRLYNVTLKFLEGGNFVFEFITRKDRESVYFGFEEGKFFVRIKDITYQADMQITPDLLHELLICLKKEVDYNSPVNKAASKMKAMRAQKASY